MLLFAFVCALLRLASAAYNESLARTEMLYLSAAAYSHTPEQCLANVIPGAQVTKSVIVDCGASFFTGTCAGYVGVAPNSKTVFLAFRGTSGFVQLVIESGATALSSKKMSPVGGQVGTYFLEVLNKLWNGGLSTALEALKVNYPDYQLWVTGHSLGGALASISAGLAAKLELFPSSNIRLVTFGQPRTGDDAYASALDQLVPESYRVTHGRDPVTHIAPYGLLGYKHHKNEVWYNNDMGANATYSQCASDGFTGCSNPDLLNVNVIDHLYYFGVLVAGACPNSPMFSVFG